MEQYWLGLVDHDGIPRRRFFEVKQTGAEIKKLSDIFVGAETKTDVLIVKSYENVWCHDIKRHIEGFDYRNLLYSYYKANNNLGTNPVCGGEDMISDKYKVVYMPAFAMISEETKARLEDYVKNGGTLVLTYRSGIKDLNNNMVTSTLPGQLRSLSGVTVQEFDSSPIEVEIMDSFGKSCLWRDILAVETAEVKAVYGSEYYAGTPAITVNSFGKGKVWYIGCDLEENSLCRLVKMISDEAEAEYIPHPDGTEIIKRSSNGKEYLMLLNYTADKTDIGIKGKSLLNDKMFDGILDGYGVEIIERSR